MDIIRDIRPLAEFKCNTTRFISHLRKTGRPSVLTVNGKPALVVMDAEAWQDLQNRIEHVRIVSAIGKGLDEARDEKGREAGAFFEKLGKVLHGAPNRPDPYPSLPSPLPPGTARRLLDEERGDR